MAEYDALVKLFSIVTLAALLLGVAYRVDISALKEVSSAVIVGFTIIVCAWLAFIALLFNGDTKLSAMSGEKLDVLLETNSLPTVDLIESMVQDLKKAFSDDNARLTLKVDGVIAKMEAQHATTLCHFTEVERRIDKVEKSIQDLEVKVARVDYRAPTRATRSAASCVYVSRDPARSASL